MARPPIRGPLPSTRQWRTSPTIRRRNVPPYKHPKLGDVRPSQVIFTYGVGALIDLPHLSVLVMGLDDWTVDGGVARTIDEERLLRTVRTQLGSQVQRLLAPPAAPQTIGQPDPFSELARIGVPVALFPRWLFCPKCQRLAPLSNGLFERRDDPFHPERTRYLHSNCEKDKQPVAVPARFLVACENGHLDDFPWIEFVHRGPTTCASLLRLIEYGPSGEARDLEVRCDACDTAPRRGIWRGRPRAHAAVPRPAPAPARLCGATLQRAGQNHSAGRLEPLVRGLSHRTGDPDRVWQTGPAGRGKVGHAPAGS